MKRCRSSANRASETSVGSYAASISTRIFSLNSKLIFFQLLRQLITLHATYLKLIRLQRIKWLTNLQNPMNILHTLHKRLQTLEHQRHLRPPVALLIEMLLIFNFLRPLEWNLIHLLTLQHFKLLFKLIKSLYCFFMRFLHKIYIIILN